MEEEYEYMNLQDDLDPGMDPDVRLDNSEMSAREAAFYRGYYGEV